MNKCCKYEPDTDTRFRSVYALNPSIPYFWKFTWGTGTEVRVSVKEDGINGTKTIDNVGVPTPKGVYARAAHFLPPPDDVGFGPLCETTLTDALHSG